MKNYAIVGFIYNQPCPLKCNFCCHTPDVVGQSKFLPEHALKIILDFSKHQNVIRFAFSGGDPFLYLEEINSIMRQARSQGVKQPFHMVTSAYWAADKQTATKIIRELAELGMDALDISYDTEHARYVKPNQIYAAISACLDYNIRVEVFGTFWHPDERVHDLLPDLPSEVVTYENLVMPIGAAKAMFNGRRYNLPRSRKMSCGKPKVYDVAIYPDGEVYPCCSGGFNKEAKLACGNVFQQSAAIILREVFSNFHVRLAKEIGFEALYRRVAATHPSLLKNLPDPDKLDSVCQICRDLHADVHLQSALSKIYDDLEIEYVLEQVDKNSQALQNSSSPNY